MKAIEIIRQAETIMDDKNMYPYTAKYAAMFGVTVTEDGMKVAKIVDSITNVYDILASPDAIIGAMPFEWVVLATCGWAAPTNNDDSDAVMPSVHPERRRVRLMSVVAGDEVASVLRFADDPDNREEDEGKAKGSLAEALVDFGTAVTKHKVKLLELIINKRSE
jgi:hypothetical protein